MKRFLTTLILSLFTASSLLMPAALAEEETSSIEATEAVEMAVQQSHLLWQLKEKLAQAEYRLFLLENNVEYAEDGLVELREAIQLVEDEIATLDAQIADKNRQILNVKSQMEEKRMEVEDLETEVLVLGEQLRSQKELVGELMSLIYYKKGIYFDSDGVNAVKVLASDETVSKTLQDVTYLNLIEDANAEQIERLNEMSEELKDKWTELHTKRAELERLDEILAEELAVLMEQRTEKLFLLDELKAEQAVLESMIISADQQEDDLKNQVEIYQKNVQLMEEKLSGTRDALTEDELAFFMEIEAEQTMSFSLQDVLTTVEFASPLPYGITHAGNEDGKLEITAYFSDEGYRALFGVDHYAIDFRAYEMTPILAVADGVVQEVVWDEDSSRYAYVKIAHRSGLITVSGHIKDPEVSAGDVVRQGDIIAYSGGTPGTPGAGARTTGPHLHLEVWHDGLRVDPLAYLPLADILQEDLPDEYQDELQSQLEDKIRVTHEAASASAEVSI